MSVLHWGDDEMHYSDNSHRWIAPENVEQNVWEAGVRAHLEQHLTTMGGPVRHDEQRTLWTRRKEARGAARTVRTTRVSRRVLRMAPGQSEPGEPSAA